MVQDTATQVGPDGVSVPFLLDDDNASLDLISRFQQLSKVDDRDPWVACSITVRRDNMGFDVDFEYENPKIWDVPFPF